MTEICTFFTFTHVRHTSFAYNFFGAFFTTFSAFFDIFIDLKKKRFGVILALFENFEARRAKKG